MPYKALTADKLILSPFNTRTDKRALQPISIGAMAKSLLKRGQIMPLVVHPMQDQEGMYGVLGGQRRLLAFEKLIAERKLPKTHKIDTVVRELDSEADLVEISTIDNLIRVDLYPHEVYASLARAFQGGKTYQQIAEDHGQPEVSWAKQGVRLGMLAAPIFQAFADDLLGLESAKAFGATDDTALQLQVYEEWKRLPAVDRNAAAIRRLMKVGDRELTRLLQFVGEEAYKAAGGRFEFDLFANEEEFRGLVSDEAMLRAMADARLDDLRKGLRARANRELRFEPGPPINDFQRVDQSLRIQPTEARLAAELEERLENLHAEQEQLEQQASELIDPVSHTSLPGKEEAVAAIEARFATNAAEIAAIEGRRPIVLPDGDIFGTITIDDTGEVDVGYWWAGRAAQAAATRPASDKAERAPAVKKASAPAPSPAPAKSADMRPVAEGNAIRARGQHGYQQDWSAGDRADSFLKRDYGLTQDGVQGIRSLRREILRTQLLENCDQGGSVARDYFCFAQLRMLLTSADSAAIGMRRFTQPDRQDNAGIDLIADTTGDRFDKALDEVRAWDCFILPDLEEAFLSYRARSADDRELAGTLLACLVLERSLQAEGYRIPLHDRVAAETGIAGAAELRESGLFNPTPLFFNQFDKDHRLSLFEGYVSRAALVVIARARTPDQNAAAAKLFCGESDDVESIDARAAACAWVHPLIAFDAIKAAAPAVVQEAAE